MITWQKKRKKKSVTNRLESSRRVQRPTWSAARCSTSRGVASAPWRPRRPTRGLERRWRRRRPPRTRAHVLARPRRDSPPGAAPSIPRRSSRCRPRSRVVVARACADDDPHPRLDPCDLYDVSDVLLPTPPRGAGSAPSSRRASTRSRTASASPTRSGRAITSSWCSTPVVTLGTEHP